jgi:predicted esterase
MHANTFRSSSTEIEALVWSPQSQEDDGRVVLYLHGAGGFGTGINGLYEHPDLPSLLRDGMRLTCSVVIPSCHIGQQWEPAVIASFLNDFEQAYDRQDQRYDLVGYSRGGTGGYQFAAAAPNRVRTLAVISSRCAPEIARSISALPVLICHGLKDQRTDVSQAQLMYDSLCQAGCDCKLELVAGDHFIIEHVLSEGLIFQWQRDAI